MSINPEFRLFIDEVGNADLNASSNPNHRYLSLTGVIFKADYARDQVTNELEELKQDFFEPLINKPLILHRKELLQGKYPFQTLRDPTVRTRFNERLLFCLADWDYKVITVVIDKLEHLSRYTKWQANPYHYCLEVMLERYVKWLDYIGSRGDVVAEARGKREDRMLTSSFKRLYMKGNRYTQSQTFQNRLTSENLKLKPKIANLAGLQIADLLAHPSYRAMKMTVEGCQIPNDFSLLIYKILKGTKYHRSTSGRILGYGQKWLP